MIIVHCSIPCPAPRKMKQSATTSSRAFYSACRVLSWNVNHSSPTQVFHLHHRCSSTCWVPGRLFVAPFIPTFLRFSITVPFNLNSSSVQISLCLSLTFKLFYLHLAFPWKTIKYIILNKVEFWKGIRKRIKCIKLLVEPENWERQFMVICISFS